MLHAQIQRKLAAILVADMVGYGLLMAGDETGTYHQFKLDLDRYFLPNLARFSGRLIKKTGDGILAEFASAMNAVLCALEVQRAIALDYNSIGPRPNRSYRIGIHLGDIIVEKDDIYGINVNIVSRLEGLADPGGICISHDVYQQVRRRLNLEFDRCGEEYIKNDPEPILVYHVPHPKTTSAAVLFPSAKHTPASPSRHSQFLGTRRADGRPSVAVQQFENLTTDSVLDGLSRSITDDLLIGLTKFKALFYVIELPNELLSPMGVDTEKSRRVAQQLRLQYLVTGNLRHNGPHIRVSIHLHDLYSGRYVWANKFELMIDELRGSQEATTQEIIANIAAQLELAELSIARYAGISNLKDHELLIQAMQLLGQVDEDRVGRATDLLKRAVQLDPNYAPAYASLAKVHHLKWRYGWGHHPEASHELALEYATRAVTIDETDAHSHAELGYVLLFLKRHDEALAEYQRASELNSYDPEIMADYADCLSYSGEPQLAISVLDRAIKLNPLRQDWKLWSLGDSHYTLGDYKAVIRTLNKMSNTRQAQRLLAASYAKLGKLNKAKWHASQVLALQPDFSVDAWVRKQPDRDSNISQGFGDGLLRAGLPKSSRKK